MRLPFGFWGSMFIVLLLAVTAAAQSCAHPGTTALATRPTFSNGTDTVQCGLVEFEYGYARVQAEGSTSGAVSSTVHMGITPRLDVRWSFDNVLTTASGAERRSGIGDAWLGARYRFNQGKNGLPSFGALYLIKLPFASPAKQQGSGYTDHSLALLMSKDLGRTHLDFNAVRMAIGSASGTKGGTFGALAISRPLHGRLSGTIEAYGGDQDGTSAALLTAISWRWSERLLTDIGIERGFWGNSGQTKVTFGMTYAVTNLYRAFGR